MTQLLTDLQMCGRLGQDLIRQSSVRRLANMQPLTQPSKHVIPQEHGPCPAQLKCMHAQNLPKGCNSLLETI